MKTILLLGATGETGKEVLRYLLVNDAVSKVITVGRRKIQIEDSHSKNIEQRTVDFDELDSKDFAGADAGVCCLGTTRGKAGAEGFVKVDHDYVLRSAELLKEQGCAEFHLLSSQGANADSSFLFNKTKGDVEKDVQALNFPRMSVYRPSILICERQESRPLERVAQSFLKIFDSGSLRFSIPTPMLAKVIVNNIFKESYASFELLTQSDIVAKTKELS